MAIGEGDGDRIDIVDWHALYARDDDDGPIIAGIAYRGRWTAIAAPAKAGKSTVLLGLAVAVAKTGLTVLYLDAEMGRGDVLDRVEEWMQLKPDDLAHLHYSDLPPHIDTVEGAARLAHTIDELQPDLVVIDGLNGVVQGAENDDTPWRDLFDLSIMPMKLRNIAVVSADNMGHVEKRPRGHSVKIDKADAILALERTENGVRLTATHRRASCYPQEQIYIVSDASEEGPPMSIHSVEGDYPAGTKELAAKLDKAGAPVEVTRRAARRMLQEAGGGGGNNATLSAAIKYRQSAQILVPPGLGPRSRNPRSDVGPKPGVPSGAPAGGAVPPELVDIDPPSLEEIF